MALTSVTVAGAVTVTVAAAVDSKSVAALTHALVCELTGGTPPPALSDYEETAHDLLSGNRFWSLLARDGQGKPIGVLSLNECASIYAGGWFGEITEFYVTPEFRGSGAGLALIKDAHDFACKRGWPRLEVGAPPLPEWQKTVAFYKARGFVEVGPRLKLLLPKMP